MRLQNAETPYNAAHGRPRKIILSLLILSAITFFVVPNAQSLTIIGNFMGDPPPSNAVGGGNLRDIFNTAAGWWQSAIKDNKTIYINYMWASLTPTELVDPFAQSYNNPIMDLNITYFDNDGSTKFFIDPTPDDYIEYRDLFGGSRGDLGDGPIETGWQFRDPPPDSPATGRIDLLSVAAHEIGHSLGFVKINTFIYQSEFYRETLDGDIDITAPRPFVGTHLPVMIGDQSHLALEDALMYSYIDPGQRRYPSEADIVAVAQLMGFSNLDFAPLKVVPEPTTILLLGSGLIALAGYGRKKFFKK